MRVRAPSPAPSFLKRGLMEQEKETILVKLNDFWKSIINIIDHIIDNIQTGIENYWKWRKIIWVDKQWDDHYILNILEFKLTLMEKYFRNSKITVDAEKNANDMKRCILLLERIIKNEYHEEAYKEFYEKYPRERIEDLASLTAPRPQPTPLQKIELTNCALKENELLESDLEELFTIMRKEIKGWWD